MTPFCDCEKDGYCPRYEREMHGRMRELCLGVNVDLGTAAAFREQWLREAGGPTNSTTSPIPLLLKTGQAPGDAVAMTAAIYSLHKAHPGKYLTAVESYWPDVFAYNPNVSPMQVDALEVEMHYPAIHQSNERGIHFMQGWCEFLGMALGVQVPLLTNRPRLYFADQQPETEDFWLVCSGGKRDFTTKLWGRYQEVIDLLPHICFIQVGRAHPVIPWSTSCQEDDHPKLTGVIDMVGKTSLRELFELTRRAKGVLCGVSLLMHVAAALEKPAIVLAGGREPVAWNAYPKQQYLHTVGTLPCCEKACWKYRVLPLGDSLDSSLCERPINGVPECMTLIRPAEVAAKVEYYTNTAHKPYQPHAQ